MSLHARAALEAAAIGAAMLAVFLMGVGFAQWVLR
jgi:hypothetical protein